MNKQHTLFCAAATLLGCSEGPDPVSRTVAEVTLSNVTFVSASGVPDEHCRLPQTLRDQVGVGRQVRVVGGSPSTLALCTVDATAAAQVDGGAARAEMSATYLRKRFGLGADAGLTVTGVEVSNQLADAGVGAVAVQQTGATPDTGFAGPDVQEWRSPTIPATANRVAYTAPHGIIETNVQSQVTRALEGAAPWSAGWIGMYRQSSSAAGFDQFHITSTEISPESFPALGAMTAAGFRYAVSFHGWSTCAGCADVVVGGGDDATFRAGVAEMLREALVPTDGGATPTVGVAAAGSELAGSAGTNFVNALANGHGLQLEQSMAVRGTTGYRDAVATTVRTYFDCLVEDADVTDGAVSSAGAAYTTTVASYTAGYCPRASVEVAAGVALTRITGEGASCVAGARAHVDVFRRRADQSYQRVGGGYRAAVVTNGACAWTDESGYVTPAGGGLAAGAFRVVVRAVTASGAVQSAVVRADG